MCDHSNQTQRVLRTLEDWLLVAHPDVVHDLDRHLADSGGTLTAIELISLLGGLANRSAGAQR